MHNNFKHASLQLLAPGLSRRSFICQFASTAGRQNSFVAFQLNHNSDGKWVSKAYKLNALVS